VRNCTPTLLFAVKATDVGSKVTKSSQLVNHFGKASTFTTKVRSFSLSAMSLVEKVGGREVANFQQRRLLVNLPKMDVFQPKNSHFWTKIFQKRKRFFGQFSNSSKFRGAATQPLRRCLLCLKMWLTN